MHKVIINSTPLISLSAINKMDILKDLYDEIIIPNAVYEEVCIEGKSKVASDIISKYDFIKVEQIKNQEAKMFFQTSLHKGEVEVMILAKEINADLCVLDDFLARKYAKHLGLKITGTLGVLLKAKEKGSIKAVKPLMDEMILNHIYIDDKLYGLVLETAKEK